MKKGITAASATIMIVVLVVLMSTITITSYNSLQNAKKLVFSLEISQIQEEVTRYYKDSEDSTYPITTESYTVNLNNVNTESVSQFNEETKDANNQIILYEIDFEAIDIEDRQYGNRKNDKDIYTVSKKTGKVYYLDGVKTKDVTYYTLTQDLIDIKERNEKENTEEPHEKPVITTTAFIVNGNNKNKKDIYLTNIKVSGDNVTKIKYERQTIDEASAQTYFKSNGKELISDRLKINEGESITIYAENSHGDWSIKYEGIPIIPEGFYYVGGSIPTGVVISDNILDANKKTEINGNVPSLELKGNQFVWVPVDEELELVQGYEWSSQQTYEMAEPALAATDNYEANRSLIYEDKYSSLLEQYQSEYNSMKQSIDTYGGFYIGRYETGGINTETVVCKAGEPEESCTGQNWYAFYKKQKELYNEETDSVVSGMIYGCQWDAVIKWMSDITNPKALYSFKQYIIDSTGMGNYTGIFANTGCFSVRNIYDMAGNNWEWSQEAVNTSSGWYRACRGGGTVTGSTSNDAAVHKPVSHRTYNEASYKTGTSRLQLYIKVK